MSDRDVLNSLQAIAQQLGSVDARLSGIDERLKGIVTVVHIGNGQESILTRLARLEDGQTTYRESAKRNWGLILGIIAVAGAVVAAVLPLIAG